MLFLISSFLAGVVFLILVEIVIVYRWFTSLPDDDPKLIPTHKPVTNPQSIREYCGIEGATDSETCMFLNLIFQFLWKEWRDSPKTRNFFIRKMNLEFQEMLLNRAAGKLMEQITVSDYYLGDSLPIIKKATVMKIDSRNPAQVPREIDIALDIEYFGGFIISLNVDLIFGKSAHFTVKLNSLVGRIRLQFTRNPCTHWSFSFYEDPFMEIDVTSNFQGKNLPKLTSFIHNQIRRSIKKKHTFPRYKVRYKPFFIQEKPQDGKKEVYLHNSLITVGKLDVEIVDCTRIPQLPKGSHIYCTLSLDPLPWKEDMPLRRSMWPVHEVLVCRDPSGSIGVSFCRQAETIEDDKREIILIKTVNPTSPANQLDIQRGDILISVNNVDVSSMKQAVRLIKNAPNKFSLKLQRPPVEIPTKEENFHQKVTDDILEKADSVERLTNETEENFDYNSILLRDEDSETEEFVNIIVNEIEKEMMDEEATKEFIDKFLRRDSSIDRVTTKGETLSSPASNLTEASTNGDINLENAKTPRRSSFLFRKKKKNTLPNKSQSDSNISTPKIYTLQKEIPSSADNLIEKSRPSNNKKRVTVIDDRKYMDSTNEFYIGESDHPLGLQQQDMSTHSAADYEWDNISHHNIEAVSDKFADEDEELVEQKLKQKTSLANGNQDPVWNEIFSFDVEKEQKFLNICVWGKCEMAFEKDILLGYVSIPLMELAVECLSTASHKNLQTFFLVATSNRQAVNRAHLRTMMPGLNLGCCNGDITIAYKYQTTLSEAELEKAHSEHVQEKDSMKEEISEETEEKPREHHFIGTELYFPTRCSYCQNKVWRKVSFQCTVCTMICHKRCIENAQANTYCTSKGVRAKQPIWQKNGFVMSTTNDESTPVSPGKAQDGSNNTVRSYPSKIPNEKDLRPGIKNEPGPYNNLRRRGKHNRRLSLDDFLKRDNPISRIPEDLEDGGLNDSITAAAITAKEAGRELFASLDEHNRENDLQIKVDKLQEEISVEYEKQNSIRQNILLTEDTETNHKLKVLLRKSEERGQALALLMIQYCAALDECLMLHGTHQYDL